MYIILKGKEGSSGIVLLFASLCDSGLRVRRQGRYDEVFEERFAANEPTSW